jgi:GTP-binding protein
VVANKTDGEEWEPHGLEASALGFGTPVCVSATSKFGMRRLIDAIYERLSVHAGTESPPHAGPDAAPHAGPDALGRPGFPSGTGTDTDMKLAIVGKRNSGKSTLVNTLAGEERVIVSEIAGTTRDSIDVRFEIEGRAMLAIDTAGLRKRSSFADDIEYYAYHRMLQAIRRADVAILLVDAAEPVSQVDQKLAQELTRQFKPVVIVVNKIDLLDKDKVSPEDYQEYLTEQLKGLNYAPIVFVSAKSGEGLRDMVAMAFNLFQQASHREPTGRINQVVEMILKERGPSSRLGKQAKLFYVTQVETNPPTLVLVVNEPKLFRGRYERYLLNRLREELPFSEVPIRVLFKKRERMSVQEMKERARETTDQHGSTQIRG